MHPDPLTGRLVRYALCPGCTDADRRERWGERIERARAALPDGAKGAELDAPWLVELVGPLVTQRARAWAAAPVDLGDTATWSLVIEGPADAAKSGLALAVAARSSGEGGSATPRSAVLVRATAITCGAVCDLLPVSQRQSVPSTGEPPLSDATTMMVFSYMPLFLRLSTM